MKVMKFWKTIIALAAFAFAGTQAKAETLTVQYTEEDRSSHTRLVEEDVEFLDFEGSSLTSLTLPEGLTSLETLKLSGNQLTRLVLPEGLSRLKRLLLGAEGSSSRVSVGFRYSPDGEPSHVCLDWDSKPGIKYQLQGRRFETDTWDGIKEVIAVSTQTEDCSPSIWGIYQAIRVVEFQEMTHLQVPWRMNTYDWEIIFAGRWKPFEEIPPSAPFRIEYYRSRPLSMRRLEDGIEIVWDEGTLQSAPNIDGPWKDVASRGTVRRLFRSSPPTEFFRLKP